MTKKKFYDERPRMEVVELRVVSQLLAGSQPASATTVPGQMEDPAEEQDL